MTQRPSSAESGELGMLLVNTVVEELHWIFRDQPKEDYGIDAHIEVVDEGVVTGRLIGLQVKCGSSFFREPAAEGWWFRPDSAHVNYWLGHSLPVVVILCDPQDKKCYWGLLDRDALVKTSNGNRKLLVPRVNLLNGSAEKAFRSIAFAPSYQPPAGGDQIRREPAAQLNPPEFIHITADPDPFFAAMTRRAQTDPAGAVTATSEWIEEKLQRGLELVGLRTADAKSFRALVMVGFEQGAYGANVVDALANVLEMEAELMLGIGSVTQSRADRYIGCIQLVSGMLSAVFNWHIAEARKSVSNAPSGYGPRYTLWDL